MKKGWEIKKLDEVCYFENGDRGKNYPNKSYRVSSGVPFINAGHLDNNCIDFSEMDYISEERFELLGNGKIKPNDILFCLRGSLGKVAIVGNLDKGAIASSLVILRIKNEINNAFLLHFLNSDLTRKQIFDFGNGAAQPNLSAGSLKKFEIPLPPLPEQQRIVSILDEAFAAIAKAKANAEQNLKNAKELFESYLQGVFDPSKRAGQGKGDGWKQSDLDDACELITCGVAARPNYVETGIPFLSAKNVKEGQVVWHGYKHITKETHQELTKNNKPLKGDLLYTRVGSYGEAAVIQNDIDFSIFVSLTLIKVDKSKLNNYFLKHYLNSEAIKSLAKKSISGSGVGNLNVGTVRKFPIFLPSLAEQELIVQQLDALRTATQKLENLYGKKIEDLEELKKSILKKAFAGEL